MNEYISKYTSGTPWRQLNGSQNNLKTVIRYSPGVRSMLPGQISQYEEKSEEKRDKSHSVKKIKDKSHSEKKIKVKK